MQDRSITLLEMFERFHGQLHLARPQRLHDLLRDRRIQKVAAQVPAVLAGARLAPLPIAFIHWIQATVAAIAHRQATSTSATHQQPLQQRQALARRAAQNTPLGIGAVALQAQLVVEKLLPAEVSRMMLGQTHAPFVTRHRMDMTLHFTLRRDRAPVLIPTIHIHPRVTGVLEQPQHPAVTQIAPHQLPAHTPP